MGDFFGRIASKTFSDGGRLPRPIIEPSFALSNSAPIDDVVPAETLEGTEYRENAIERHVTSRSETLSVTLEKQLLQYGEVLPPSRAPVIHEGQELKRTPTESFHEVQPVQSMMPIPVRRVEEQRPADPFLMEKSTSEPTRVTEPIFMPVPSRSLQVDRSALGDSLATSNASGIAAAPTIKISIGRVEVRAIVTPPAPTPTRSAPKPKPKSALQEYLEARNRGTI